MKRNNIKQGRNRIFKTITKATKNTASKMTTKEETTTIKKTADGD